MLRYEAFLDVVESDEFLVLPLAELNFRQHFFCRFHDLADVLLLLYLVDGVFVVFAIISVFEVGNRSSRLFRDFLLQDSHRTHVVLICFRRFSCLARNPFLVAVCQSEGDIFAIAVKQIDVFRHSLRGVLALGVIAHFQSHLRGDVGGFLQNAAVSARLCKVLIAPPQQVAQLVVGERHAGEALEPYLAEHVQEERFYFLPPARVNVLEVRIFRQRSQIFFGGSAEVPTVLRGKPCNAAAHILVGVLVDVVEERVEVEKEAALAAKEEAEKERQTIEVENKAKEQYRQSLDTEIADKERQLKDERKAKMDSILDSVGSLVGVGKYAAIEKENAKLKADNERIRKTFPDAVKNKVAELTQALVADKRKAEDECDRALVHSRSLGIERDKAVRQLQEQQANEQQHIRQAVNQATAEKDKTIRLLESALAISRKLLNAFADFLFHTSEIFKRAIQAIIHFGTEHHQSFFAPSEAADIKSVMQEYGETTEQQNAVGAWPCDYAEI